MRAGIGIICEDVAVGRWLTEWIAAMRLAPPDPVTIAVRVGPLAPDADGDLRAPFLQPQLEIRSGPPENDVRVRWLAGPARAVIAAGSRTAEVAIGPEALARREPLAQSFLSAVLILLLRRVGWHHVHAALARDPTGRDWLFAGDARSGKSTTAALLATWGWAVGSDDITFLARDGAGVAAIAQRARIALRPAAAALFGPHGRHRGPGRPEDRVLPRGAGGLLGRARRAADPHPAPRRGRRARAPSRSGRARRSSSWCAGRRGWRSSPTWRRSTWSCSRRSRARRAAYRVALGPDLFARRDLLLELDGMTTRYARHPDLRLTALEGEGVALHLGTRRYYTVSESGLDILEALATPRTLPDLVAVLTEKYDVSVEQAEATTRAFLERGLRTGTLVAEDVP